MFKPVENGSVIEIEDNAFGYVFKCHLPPVGYGVNSITGELEETDILKRSDIPEEQYWERYSLPKEWKAKRAAEKKKQEYNKNYFDPYLESIRRQEWKRRLCGVWFWNYNPYKKESQLIYLTGQHYLYCTWWKFQGKYMDFRITDRDVWYVIKYCENDPDSLGLNFLTRRKLGKCFGKDTLIRMYDGSVKAVQDVKDGDLVMGDDSTPRVVSGVTSGIENMYSIVPKKGGEGYVCNESHLLHVKFNGCKRVRENAKWQKDKTYNFTVPEYLALGENDKDHLVQYKKGWGSHFEEKEHALPPYILGVWLGDGKSTGAMISSADHEILSAVSSYCDDNGLMLKHKVNYDYSVTRKEEFKTQSLSVFVDGEEFKFDRLKDAHSFFGEKENIGSVERTRYYKKHKVIQHKTMTQNSLTGSLKKLNVLGNKHIPNEYLIDLEKNRLELLAGIIDTDGHLAYNRNGNPCLYEITQKRQQLSYDIVELSRSLGFYTTIKTKNATMKRSDGTKYECLVYRITIWGQIDRIPCKVERKKAKFIEGSRRKDSLNFGFRVKPLGIGEYFGFAVDKNNLFLLADGTVVHNTAISGCWAYERTSRRPSNQHCGIQSKDDDGAEEVFKKAIIQPWQKLPDFFRPIYDTMKGDDPSVLRFFHTSRRGSVTEEEREEEEALESWIDYGPATEGYYDGPELDTYISDEAGKVEKKISIRTRQDVVRYCSEIDGRMKGKQLYTTTVEADETTADEHEFQELVYDSNPLKRNANNRTTTGLYTLFLPAHKAYYFEGDVNAIYGYPDVQRATDYLLNTRKNLEEQGKLRQLASAKRKNPMTLQEAFSVDGEYSVYNPILLQEQLDRISWGDKKTEFGDLVWVDGKEFLIEENDFEGNPKLVPNKLEWVPNSSGRYEKVIGWKPKEPNAVIERNGLFTPNANYLTRIGCDPFRYDKTKDKRRSNCAAFAYQIKDPNRPDPEFDEIFGMRYSFRAESTMSSNADILKMAWWCGCQVLFERNVNHWKDHFNNWKCSGFLMWMPNEVEPGVFTGGDTKGGLVQTICNYTESYINEHYQKVYFRTLMDKQTGWLGFKVEDTQKFDEPMAAGITLLAVKGKRYTLPSNQTREIESILPYNKAI